MQRSWATPATDPQAYEAVAEFAGGMGMIPMKLKKEKAGYILNSMLVPFLMSAQELLADGIADVETIDKTWMLSTGAPFGPFRILDIVGITTAYNIIMNYPDATDPHLPPRQAGQDAEGGLPGSGQNRHQRRRRLSTPTNKSRRNPSAPILMQRDPFYTSSLSSR